MLVYASREFPLNVILETLKKSLAFTGVGQTNDLLAKSGKLSCAYYITGLKHSFTPFPKLIKCLDL